MLTSFSYLTKRMSPFPSELVAELKFDHLLDLACFFSATDQPTDRPTDRPAASYRMWNIQDLALSEQLE
jgi:hypothetical protein